MKLDRTVLGSVWIDGGGRENRVKLTENKLIFGHFYSTPPPLPNPNKPLVTTTCVSEGLSIKSL